MGLSGPLPRDRRSPAQPRTVRRASDRLQSASRALMVLAVALAVPVGVAQGATTAEELREQAAAQAADLELRDLVLLARAQPTPGRQDGLTRTPVTWLTAEGPRDATVLVPQGSDAGDVARVWFDGDLPTSPLTDDAAGERAVVTGVFTALGVGAFAVAGHLAVVAALDRHRLRRWAVEWRSVEPSWSGRA